MGDVVERSSASGDVEGWPGWPQREMFEIYACAIPVSNTAVYLLSNVKRRTVTAGISSTFKPSRIQSTTTKNACQNDLTYTTLATGFKALASAYSRRNVNGPCLMVTRNPDNTIAGTLASRLNEMLCVRKTTVAPGRRA